MKVEEIARELDLLVTKFQRSCGAAEKYKHIKRVPRVYVIPSERAAILKWGKDAGFVRPSRHPSPSFKNRRARRRVGLIVVTTFRRNIFVRKVKYSEE